MNTAETIALASASIAFLSLVANIVLIFRNQKLTKQIAASQQNFASMLASERRAEQLIDSDVDALEQLHQALRDTAIFELYVENENWQYGFSKLRAIRTHVSSCEANLLRSSRVPDKLKSRISALVNDLNDFTSLSDNYNNFILTKKLKDKPPEIAQKQWPSLRLAENKLAKMQPEVRDLLKEVREYIERAESKGTQ